jgi:SpoU rRNA Methylase family
MRRALTTAELRRKKVTRDEFLGRPRRPITIVLDGVSQNYNIGAIFRLCDAFLVQQLVICGTKVNLRKRSAGLKLSLRRRRLGLGSSSLSRPRPAFAPSSLCRSFQSVWCSAVSVAAYHLRQWK